MSDEPKLAYTVHHKGRKYRGGSTAADIGPAAADIGAHAWVGGIAPEKAKLPGADAPVGGTLSATPPVPAPSALPTPAEPEEQPTEAVEAKKVAGRRAGGA